MESGNFPPKRGSSVAPGMTQPIEAGQQYTITDTEGQELLLEGRDDPLVIEFLHAFDHFLLVDRTMPEDAHSIHDAAWKTVREKWEALPMRIVNELPSVRAGGIVIPGQVSHDH